MPTAPGLAASGVASIVAGASPATAAASAPTYAPYAPPVTPTALTRPSVTAIVPVSQPTAGETIVRPMEHTLARGRYEAKVAQIWLVVGAGLLLALFYAFARVRQTRRRESAKMSALMTLRREGVSKAS